MLIVYDENHTNIDNMLEEFNSAHPNIQYTVEKQTNNTLNYLDISIENTHNYFIFNIYRKPTTTDLIISGGSRIGTVELQHCALHSSSSMVLGCFVHAHIGSCMRGCEGERVLPPLQCRPWRAGGR
jgi:hypothetical protein